MVKKKQNLKEKFLEIIKSYKTIIYISFILNIILLFFIYYIMNSNKIYTFSGSDDYLKVNDGLIVLNNDINLLNGNNIEYINNVDYDIKAYKIGYYVMNGTKLVEIISTNLELDTEIKLSELVKNFTTINVAEKNSKSNYFTHDKKALIADNLYLIMEAKSSDGNVILSKVKLNVSKISK